MEIWRLKDNGVTTLIFWGHVTSSITWPFDSRWATSYGWSIVTIRLFCTVTEILSLKLVFAHVKGRKFTAQPPCHVTCMQGVQNDRIFEFPIPILPIHYANFVELRRRLRVVCRWTFPVLSIFSQNFLKSENGPKICYFGGLEGKNIKDECWDPLGNQSPPQHVIQCKKIQRYSQKCVLQSFARKVKKERKNNPVEHYISPFCPVGLAGPICAIFGR